MTESDAEVAAARLQAAVEHHKSGRFVEAEILYREVLRSYPDNAPVLDNLGLALFQQGRLDDAVAILRRAVDLDSTLVSAALHLGDALQAKGEITEALAVCRTLAVTAPNSAPVQNNLGVVLRLAGDFEGAAAACRRAVDLAPDLAEAHSNLGVAFKDLGRLEEAEAAHRRAVMLRPENADFWCGLGKTLQLAGRNADAIGVYGRALSIAPRHAGAIYNLGFLLKEAGQLDKAIAAHRLALDINPGDALIREQLIHEQRHACDWRGLEPLIAAADEAAGRAVAGGRAAVPPFLLITRSDDAALHRDNAIAWAREQCGTARVFAHSPAPARERLTIGYLSADFHDHATAHLLGGLFGLHDRKRFCVHAYSYGPVDDGPWRRRVAGEADSFVQLEKLDDQSAAGRIHADAVDILVDLKGWTQGSRMGVCARRPAPVQATWLGFPGTTGATFIDYAIVDRFIAPEGDDRLFSEKLVRLPHSYQVNDPAPRVSAEPMTRAALGLPVSGLVFASFNQPYKIEPEMFDLWMRLLVRVPGSVLWQLCANELAGTNLKREAAARGIDPARIVPADMWPKDRHLTRLGFADLVLDTRTCCGHTSTSDALSVGVPVVALRGTHFASRVSASCLNALGLPELVADNLQDYEAMALKLGRDVNALAEIRRRLADARSTAALFDASGFARALEQAYLKMWELHRRGETPQPIMLQA